MKNKRVYNRMNIYEKIILIILAIVIFYPPYARGLFFGIELIPFHIILFSLFTLILLKKVVNKNYELLKKPLDYSSMALVLAFLLPIVFSQTANMSKAIEELLKYFSYFLIYLIIKEVIKNKKAIIVILNIIIASTIGLIIVSIDGAAGGKIAEVIQNIINIIPGMNYKIFGVYAGDRMNSMLQYPNAFASYLLAGFMICITLLLNYKNRFIKGMYGGLSFLILITFIFTYSRGAWVLFPIVCMIYLIFLWNSKYIAETIIYYIAIGLTTIGATPFLYKYLNTGNPKTIWLTVIGGFIITSLITFIISLITTYIYKVSNKKLIITFSIFIITVIIVATTFTIHAFDVEKPVILSHTKDEEEKYKSVSKVISPAEHNTEYVLKFNTDFETADIDKWAFRLDINSINEKSENTNISRTYSSDLSKGTQEIDFETIEDTEKINIRIYNRYKGTSVKIDNAVLINNNTKQEQKVIFRYKYIPDTLATRLNDIELGTKSSEARITFYKDALKIIKDYAIIGAGGGAWGSLYFMYQSYMYWSNQVHNYYLQFYAETGTIGIIALLLWIFFIFRRAYRYRKLDKEREDNILIAGLGIAVFSLLAHAFIDFDLTLGAMSLLLWELVALIMVLTKDLDTKINKSNTIRNIEFIIISVITIGLLIFTINLQSGILNYQKGKRFGQINEYDKSVEYIEKAVNDNPFNAEYKKDLAKLYHVVSIDKKKGQIVDKDKYIKVDKLLKDAIKLEPYNSTLYTEAANLSFNRGMIDKGLEYIDNAIKYQPLNNKNYENKAAVYLNLGLSYLNNQDYKKAEEAFNTVIDIPFDFKELNKKILKPISLTPETLDIISRANYLLNNYKDPESIHIFNRLKYNSYFVDANMDNAPDGWSISKKHRKYIGIDNNLLSIKGNNNLNLYSSYFKLEPKTLYTLKVEASGNIGKKDKFNILLYSQEGEKVQFNSKRIDIIEDKKVYEFEIATTEDLAGEQRLRIYYNTKDEKSNVTISDILLYNKYVVN